MYNLYATYYVIFHLPSHLVKPQLPDAYPFAKRLLLFYFIGASIPPNSVT